MIARKEGRIMQISALTQSKNAANNDTSTPKHVKISVQQQRAQKKDSVVISEKAKDLAAQQSGQANVEEAKESLSAKALEAPVS
jgi:hypothetical protein